MEIPRIRREILGDAHPHIASTLHLLGVLLMIMGEMDDEMHCLLGAPKIQCHVFDGKEKVNVPTTTTNTTMLDVIVNDASSTNSKENTESNPLVT
eukprot:12608012-Ditylum_brightwellii.AAC.1